ncbi:MAG: hypothetical protein JEY71_04705 [Sphaerochaeta sp.]|nr:hypothetical protein [Sphaerochaeta sp.]
MKILPEQISYNDITNTNSFSPSNYSVSTIRNQKQLPLESFLTGDYYIKGIEPGNSSYVKKSDHHFIRNSCIDSYNLTSQQSKEIYLNPNLNFPCMLENEDVLLCKDANIGDSCMFLAFEQRIRYSFSSGIVKLLFKSNELKFYCLAFLNDEYFKQQLETFTPRGATIKHAGRNFLRCMLPEISPNIPPLLPYFEILQKNIAYSEILSKKRLEKANQMFSKEMQSSIGENLYQYEGPSISIIENQNRLDAGNYSRTVEEFEFKVKNYKFGKNSLDSYGYLVKRGPNLAKRDLGRSIKSDSYIKNYHLLVYPSDISDNGYLLKALYIGARNPVWFLGVGDILFSAEGTVGKTFIICDKHLSFTTNFHGIIVSPKKAPSYSLKRSILLGQYLIYCKDTGYLDKLSVGGQGGSLALGYWERLEIPNFTEEFMNLITPLYYSETLPMDPLVFDICKLENAGVYELNELRLKSKELLKKIISDIKNDDIKSIEFYKHFFD